MPKVELQIGNNTYSIACNEGEEERVRMLAKSLNVRLGNLSRSFNSASDNLIMAISALMMEDEIKTLQQKVSNVQPAQTLQIDTGISESQVQERVNNAVAEIIEPIADSIEELANSLENV